MRWPICGSAALVGPRWWDDVWLDEAIATYLSYAALAAIAGVSESLSWTGVRLHRQAAGLPGGRPAEPAAGVVSGEHGRAGPGQAVRHPVREGRQRHPLPRRAHRRRRAAARAERLPDAGSLLAARRWTTWSDAGPGPAGRTWRAGRSSGCAPRARPRSRWTEAARWPRTCRAGSESASGSTTWTATDGCAAAAWCTRSSTGSGPRSPG